MKKVLILTSILFFLTGCSEKIVTCSVKNSEFEQTWKYITKKDKIKEVELDILYNNSLFGIESLHGLNSTEKVVIKKEILSKLGFEKSEYNGLKLDIIVTDNINVKIKADLEKCDKSLLKQLGINFDNNDINSTVEIMTEKGAICK